MIVEASRVEGRALGSVEGGEAAEFEEDHAIAGFRIQDSGFRRAGRSREAG